MGAFSEWSSGGLLVYVGLAQVGGGGGTTLALAGLLPILAGTLNVCLIAPLIRAPFKGRGAIRPGMLLVSRP